MTSAIGVPVAPHAAPDAPHTERILNRFRLLALVVQARLWPGGGDQSWLDVFRP